MTVAIWRTPRSSSRSLKMLRLSALHASADSRRHDSLHVVPHGCQRELGPIVAQRGVAIFCRDRASTPVRAAQAVDAHHEEPRDVECLPRAAQHRTPPIADVGATSQGVAYHHGVVAGGRERAMCSIRNGYMAEDNAGFEGDLRDDGEGLVRNQLCERVLWLFRHSLYVSQH